MINPGAELGEAVCTVPAWLARVPSDLLSSNAKVVYAKLFQWDQSGIKADRGLKEISLSLGMSVRTAGRALRELKKAGLIETTKRFTGYNDIEFLVHEWMGFDLVGLSDPEFDGHRRGLDTLGFATLEKVMLGFAGKSPVPLRDLSANECGNYAPAWLLLLPDEHLSIDAKVVYLKLTDWFLGEETFEVTTVDLIRATGMPLPMILEATTELKWSDLISIYKNSVREVWEFYFYVHPWMKNEDAKFFYTGAAPGEASQSELAAKEVAKEVTEEVTEEIAGETVKEIRSDARILH